MVAFLWKKATNGKLFYKTWKNEKNKIKQKADFTMPYKKIKSHPKSNSDLIANKRPEQEFCQATPVSAINSNDHKLQKEAEEVPSMKD